MRRQQLIMSNSQVLGCRTLRALGFSGFVNLGFRFAPPQALSLHYAGLEEEARSNLIRAS